MDRRAFLQSMVAATVSSLLAELPTHRLRQGQKMSS